MEDILALIIVLAVAGLIVWIGAKLYSRIKQEREQRAIRRAEQEKTIAEMRKKFTVSPSMQGYVNMLDRAEPVKVRKPAMKKANVNSSYANTTSTATSSTVAVPSSDDGFLSGMLVGAALDNMFSHKSEPVSKSSDTGFSWGLDDSDSRKSISSSMDTSSSSDSWSSSDSGPSSDW